MWGGGGGGPLYLVRNIIDFQVLVNGVKNKQHCMFAMPEHAMFENDIWFDLIFLMTLEPISSQRCKKWIPLDW